MNIGGPEVVFFVVLLLIPALVFWRIFDKAGRPGAYGLLMLIPFVNIVMLLVLAFAEWPIQRALRALRADSSPT